MVFDDNKTNYKFDDENSANIHTPGKIWPNINRYATIKGDVEE